MGTKENLQIFQFWVEVDKKGIVRTEKVFEMAKRERKVHVLSSKKHQPYLQNLGDDIFLTVEMSDLGKPLKNTWVADGIVAYYGHSLADEVSKATLISNVEQMVYKDVFMNFMSALEMINSLEYDKFSDEQRKILETILTRMRTPKNDEDDTTF